MMFRSPPPHRRSSGRRGGSDFEQEQRDFQALVERVGFDNLPLNDDALRPFLAHLWDFAERSGEKVYTFDSPDAYPGRLFYGLMGYALPLNKLANQLMDELRAIYTREEIARAGPMFNGGKTSVCYFKNVWTPKGALASRRH